MRANAHSPIDDLRLAIDCLPVRTREAMLEGIRANDIIVGAYTDRDGGVCPMLAAHRHGGRTNFVSFAHAWDRFAGVKRARPPRDHARAPRRSTPSSRPRTRVAEADLAGAIADHQAIARDRRAREARGTGRGWPTSGATSARPTRRSPVATATLVAESGRTAAGPRRRLDSTYGPQGLGRAARARSVELRFSGAFARHGRTLARPAG